MTHRTRREFLADVGQGMLVASVGYAAALDMGLTKAFADDRAERLDFGSLEPLVRLMQDTAPEKLLPILADQLKGGAELRTLVAGAALANARTFGGQDYVGFHTLMALSPAWQMAQLLPAAQKPLPVFKVLYRNTNRIQEHGGPASEVLHAVKVEASGDKPANGETLKNCVLRKDMTQAEQAFAQIAARSPEEAFNELLLAVHEESEVHRVVLPYRAWDLLDIVGREHAQTLLRQSLRYCVHNESETYRANCRGGADVLPKLLDQYKLPGKKLGNKAVDAVWVDAMARTIFESEPDRAADAVAAALADGVSLEAIGEAMSVAANQLVLRDRGRTADQARPGKPEGSVHGDSVGVHACDSANAWRNMARVSNPHNAIASLILGVHQVATDRIRPRGDFLNWQPYPTSEHRDLVNANSAPKLLAELEESIRGNEQARAVAVVARYAELGASHEPVVQSLLKYAISEDGSLHAEKYFRTATEEFQVTRPELRWKQLMALARVTASEFGQPAPGYAEAVRLVAG